MRAEYIKVEPFKFKQMLEVRIEKGINSHGWGLIRGYIRKEDEETYASYPIASTPVILRVVDEDGQERIFFYGILADVRITHENSQLLLEAQFTAYTRLMDLTKQTRAYQEGTCTYQGVLADLCKGYEGAAFIMQTGFSNTQIKELVVQYQETNWEFLLRLASHFNSVVIADYLTPGVKFYFGLPDRQPKQDVSDSEYRLEKSLITHMYKEQNGVTGTSEYDEMSVILKSRELFEVGDRVLFEDRPYVVCQSVSGLDGHQMKHTYVLMTENGLKMPKLYNEKIIGASIDGVVGGVQMAVVKVQLGIEDLQPSARWYPFATVFSSPDGSGWYCMPQAGDEIRLYFPTRSEKHAYVVSSVHRPVSRPSSGQPASKGKEASRMDPGKNELRSQDNKVVQLLSDRIVLDNGQGLTITMVDGKGIDMVSSGHLKLKAASNVYINGSSLNMSGSSAVTIQGGNSTIQLTDTDVVIKGTNVKVQK